MITITGKYTNANIMTDNVEPDVIKQVTFLCNHPLFEGKKIVMQADTHPGQGTCIGTCAEIDINHIIPWMVGTDMGCTVSATKIEGKTLKDFNKLDKVIKNLKVKKNRLLYKYAEETIHAICSPKNWYETPYLNSLGTIGQGNHFISIEQGETGTYLLIHSGSRNLGKDLHVYYGKKALEQNPYAHCGELKQLSYLDEETSKQYCEDLIYAETFAKINHHLIASCICNEMKWDKIDWVPTELGNKNYILYCPHNYIDFEHNVLHKGSIRLGSDALGIIPINMADGTFIVQGTGNPDYLNSAPHGAGRLMSRADAKSLDMKEYKNRMKNVYSSCVNVNTIDESPTAYKPIEQIKESIKPICEIVDHLVPIYNFKG